MGEKLPFLSRLLSWLRGRAAGRPEGVRAEAEFRKIVDRERARVDRNAKHFSLVLFEAVFDRRHLEPLIWILRERVRTTDEIGLLADDKVGVVLPETMREGAVAFAEDVRSRTQELIGTERALRFTVHTYPDAAPRGDSTGRDAHAKTPEPATLGEPATLASALPEDIACGPISLWKRALDIAGAIIGLAILSPFFIAIAATIKLVSRGPVFFKQTRIGYRGRPFLLWKFRTMKAGSDSTVHARHLKELIACDIPMTKLDARRDPRVIPFGAFLRASSLDELPQLINVLRGEMSLIGPRPCMPYEAEAYRNWQHRRFDVLPGMTGLWQVSGKNRTTFTRMMRLDVRYARRRCAFTDLKIMLKTLPAVLRQVLERASNRWSRKDAKTA